MRGTEWTIASACAHFQPAARAHSRRGRAHHPSSVPIQTGAPAYDGYGRAQAPYGKPWPSHLMRAPTVSSGCVGANNRAMSGSDSVGPQLGAGDITRNRPTIRAVALPIELHILHDVVEGSRIFRGHAIVELNHQWAAPVRQREPHLRIASMSASSPRSVIAGMGAKQRQEQHQTSSVMPTPTLRGPQRRQPTKPQRIGPQPRGRELHVNVEQRLRPYGASKNRAAAARTEL